MSDQHYLLLMADISGYTPFMRLHAMSLAHAQDIVTDLIDGVIDASGAPFKLCKIEGDAAFLYAPIEPGQDLSWLPDSVTRMQRAFHALRRETAASTVCVCDACRQADELRVKFVAHAGPARAHSHRGVVDLGGFEVIVLHRMLKVAVPAREYLLVSRDLLAHLPAPSAAAPLKSELEGVGPADFRYFKLVASAAGDSAALPLWRRWKISLHRTWRTLPALLGLEKPCSNFRNVADAALAAR